MLISLVLQLKPLKEGTLPPITGPALHAVFFGWLSSQDAALAEELHDLKGLKPFTVSNLQAGGGLSIEDVFAPTSELVLDCNGLYWFRITSLDKRLSQLLLTRLYEQPPATLDILKRQFKVERVIAEQTEHPWAGVTSWQNMIQHELFSEKNPLAHSNLKLKLVFCSPTTFKERERVFLFPLPMQTFTSLAMRWNTFSPVSLDPTLGSYLAESVGVSAYQLQTELTLLEGSRNKSRMVCFRGWCEYSCFDGEAEWFSALQMLGHFAFYSGVGYKSTMGFGQTLVSK